MYIEKRTGIKYSEITSNLEVRDKSHHIKRKPCTITIIVEDPKVKNNIPYFNIGKSNIASFSSSVATDHFSFG